MKVKEIGCSLVAGAVLVVSSFFIFRAYQLQAGWWSFTDQVSPRIPSQLPLSSSPPRLLCEMIQTQELETLVGQALAGPERSILSLAPAELLQSCLWIAADGGYSPTISVSLQSATSLESENSSQKRATESAELSPQTKWTAAYEENKTLPGFEVMKSLGDESFLSSRGLYIRQGDQMIRVFVSLSDRSQNRSVLEQIGTQLIEQLLSEQP